MQGDVATYPLSYLGLSRPLLSMESISVSQMAAGMRMMPRFYQLGHSPVP